MYSAQFKDSMKQIWNECNQASKDSGFVEGVILGALAKDNLNLLSEILPLFEDWRQSVNELEIKDDSKKILMYSTYFNTYVRTKEANSFNVDSKIVIKKDVDSNTSSNSCELTKEDFPPVSGKSDYRSSSESYNVSGKNSIKEDVDLQCKVESSGNSTQGAIGLNILKQDTRPELTFHKCSFCHKISSRAKIINECGHHIHVGCLKMKVISNLISSKYKIDCHDKLCKTPIKREVIFPVLNENAKICYNVLELLHELNESDPDTNIFWCYSCRTFSARNSSQNSKCECCDKKQDKLKNVLTLLKLILVDSNSMVKDFRNYNAICKCVEDCKQNFQRCEECKQWKHTLTISSFKCICIHH